MPSLLLKRFHNEHCPNLSIDSIEFTNFLINEVLKLKEETKKNEEKHEA